MNKQPPYFANDDHALQTGMLLGHLMSHDVICAPGVDVHGNYTNEIFISLEPGLDSQRIKVEVLPE